MLNIEVNRSAEGPERYFDRELAVSDYLMKEPGICAGRGTLLAQRLTESGYRLRRTDRGWHQWEMACITDREIELFSKRHELIDTLSEERGSTPEEEMRIAHQERDSKTTKLFYGKAELRIGVSKWECSGATR